MSSSNKQNTAPSAEKLAARKAMEEAEKAEFLQAVMSLYIPFSLFIACCVFAAGAFMVYYDEPAGWGFIAATGVIALSAFIGLFKFQNKLRAKGIIPTRDTVVESNILDMSVEADNKSGAGTTGDAESQAETEADMETVTASEKAPISVK